MSTVSEARGHCDLLVRRGPGSAAELRANV